MNTQEYIASGIIEAYQLGALPQEEQEQVAANVALYPELANELREIENAMFLYCQSFAITPPAALEDKIWSSLSKTNNSGNDKADQPIHTKTIPLNPEYRKPQIWRYAAVWVALISSLALNYFLWDNSSRQKSDAVALNEQLIKMQDSQKRLEETVSNYHNSKLMMADTAIQTIVMHTMQKGHPMAATLYWSKGSGDAYVAMDALPMPPKGMQYQLWVIQNGKPVSMGTLANDMVNSPVMQKIAMAVTSGEAFAISLEKEGGNPTPTAVYVLGKV